MSDLNLEPLEIGGDVYIVSKTFADGRLAGVKRLMYHWTLQVGIDQWGYADSYCYQTLQAAVIGLTAWEGEGDPVGWHRNPKTGRRP